MKKTLAIILSIIMLISVCPIAFAADETPQTSVELETARPEDSKPFVGEWIGVTPTGYDDNVTNDGTNYIPDQNESETVDCRLVMDENGREANSEDKFVIVGQKLNLNKGLAMEYYVEAYDHTDVELSMRFLFLGEYTTEELVLDEETGLYVATLKGITPQCMGENIEAWVMQDGVEVGLEGAELLNYSVKQNLTNLLAEYPEDQVLVTLINDLFAYGKAAEAYTGYESLGDIEYTASNRDVAKVDVPEITGGARGGYTVQFGMMNYLKVYIVYSQYYEIYVNGEQVSFDNADDDVYTSSGIAATDFDKVFLFHLLDTGAWEATTIDFELSVNAYLAAIYEQSSDDKMKALALALYNYGLSADCYAGDHTWVDGVCDVCGSTCETVGHTWVDGVCDVCGGTCETVGHSWVDGTCDVCGEVCEHESWSNGICSVCGYNYFADAKVLTADENGKLLIDGVLAEANSKGTIYYLPTGKYKITENITTAFTIWVDDEQNVVFDLNGYTWDLGSKHITINGTLSVYDTSSAQTGKMVSTENTILTNGQASVFNLYSGTLESTGSMAVCSNWGETYLYGGTVKGATHAVHISNVKVKLCGTVLESGEGYPTLSFGFSSEETAEDANPIDVSEYTGESLSVAVSFYDTTGDIPIIKGIKNAQDAERYTIESVTISEEYVKEYGLFYKDTIYNEETGEISVVIDALTFTQQPSNDNNYTADTNNAKATYQWYETVVENSTASVSNWDEIVLTGDFKAGDSVTISTEDDIEVDIMTIPAGDMLHINRHHKSVTYTFDADLTFSFITAYVRAPETPVNLNITVMRDTRLLEGETGKSLSAAEKGKTYFCMATLGEYSTSSNFVTSEHTFADDGDCTTTLLCTCCNETVKTANATHAAGEAVTENEVEVSCTIDGTYDVVTYCTICGDEATRETIITTPAPGHNTNGTVTHKDAKCEEDGVVGGTYCDACDLGKAEAEEIIPASGHNSNGTVTHKDANCTEDGVVGGTYCDACDKGKEEAEEIIPASGHNSNGTVTHKDAKCEEDGIVGGTYCDVCDYGKAEAEAIIPATGHNTNGKVAHKDAKCEEDGVVGGTYCDVCDEGKAEAEKVIPAFGHGKTEIRGKVDATETTEGYTGDTYCTVCDKKIADGKVIPMAGTQTPDEPDTPDEPETPDDPDTTDCDHMCHSENWFFSFLWKVINFFQKLFKINPVCECGVAHY